MRNNTTRPLPRLIALPMPELSKQPRRHIPKPPQGRPEQPDGQEMREAGIRDQAIMESMDALRAVMALTESFIHKGPAYVRDVSEWLAQLKSALEELEEGLSKGWLDGVVTIESDGVNSLDATLDATPDLDAADDDVIDIVAQRCLRFWIEEIKRRGRELVDICIVSVDVAEAKELFGVVRTMRYPIK